MSTFQLPPSYLSAFEYNSRIQSILKQISTPFLEKMGLTYFCHTVFFNNGKQLNIMTNLEFFKYGLEHNLLSVKSQLFCKRVQKVPIGQSCSWVWTGTPTDSDFLYRELYDFDIWNGITICNRSLEKVECWSFGTNRENQDITYYYLNNLSVFIDFINFFKTKTKDHIGFDKSELIISGYNLPPYNPSSERSIKEIKKLFISRTTSQDKRYLTPREIEALRYLAQGKLIKETASIMNITPKTLEYYLSRARKRLDCNSKSTLINFFNEIYI
ncbi:MAG: helix-turn-helix transcriptional regulator [Candidatus Rhabdochlamydia sp.]